MAFLKDLVLKVQSMNRFKQMLVRILAQSEHPFWF